MEAHILPVPSFSFDTFHTLPEVEDLTVGRIGYWRHGLQCYLALEVLCDYGHRSHFAAAVLANIPVGIADSSSRGAVLVHPIRNVYNR